MCGKRFVGISPCHLGLPAVLVMGPPIWGNICYFPWNAPEFPWDIRVYHGSSHLTPCFPRRFPCGAFHGIPNDHMGIPTRTGIQVDRARVCHLGYPTEIHTRSMRYRINITTGLDPSGSCGSSHRMSNRISHGVHVGSHKFAMWTFPYCHGKVHGKVRIIAWEFP